MSCYARIKRVVVWEGILEVWGEVNPWIIEEGLVGSLKNRSARCRRHRYLFKALGKPLNFVNHWMMIRQRITSVRARVCTYANYVFMWWWREPGNFPMSNYLSGAVLRFASLFTIWFRTLYNAQRDLGHGRREKEIAKTLYYSLRGNIPKKQSLLGHAPCRINAQ